MKKLLAFAALAALGAAALAAPSSPAGNGGTHYWLHPKLGMVKVDSRTHAIVVPGRNQGQRDGKPGAPAR